MTHEDVPNPVLREHVTSGAFQITLSKTQLAVLTALWHSDSAYMACVRDTCSAYGGLKRRGLTYSLDEVSMHAKEVASGKLPPHLERYLGEWMMSKPFGTFTKLTKAGELMCLLLIEAGLLTERKRVVDKLGV